MSRTCSDCGSSWDGRATFCGRCGGLLDEGLATHGDRRDVGAWWRRPWFGALAVAVLVAGAVAAVPRLSVERTPPVAGEIGVPQQDDLNAAPASSRRRTRAAPPPEVTCTVDGAPVECVQWSREVLSPAAPDRGGGWFGPMGRDHLVTAGEDGFTAYDAGSGTRLWRSEGLAGVYPIGASDGRVLLEGPGGTSLRDLDDGTVLWSTPAGSGFLGGAIVGRTAILGEHTETGDTRLRGRAVADGATVWEHDLPGALHIVGEAAEGRVMLAPGDGRSVFMVVDAASGELLSRLDAGQGWVAGVVDDVALVVTEPTVDPSAPNLAGDGGATLTAHRLDDGTVAWRRELRSSQMPVNIAADTVLVPSTDRVLALEVATGEPRWTLDLPGSTVLAEHGSGAWWNPAADRDDWSTVAVLHDQVDDTIHAHDLSTGEVVWERAVEAQLQHVFVTRDLLAAHSASGVTLLDPGTGTEQVSVALDGAFVSGWAPLTVFDPSSGYGTRLLVPGVDVP